MITFHSTQQSAATPIVKLDLARAETSQADFIRLPPDIQLAALVTRSSEELGLIERQLSSTNWQTQAVALKSIVDGQLHHPSLFTAITNLLSSAQSQVFVECGEALRLTLGDRSATNTVNFLNSLSKNPNPEIRRGAQGAKASVGRDRVTGRIARVAEEAMIDDLSSQDPATRGIAWNTVRSLLQFMPAAQLRLIKILGDEYLKTEKSSGIRSGILRTRAAITERLITLEAKPNLQDLKLDLNSRELSILTNALNQILKSKVVDAGLAVDVINAIGVPGPDGYKVALLAGPALAQLLENPEAARSNMVSIAVSDKSGIRRGHAWLEIALYDVNAERLLREPNVGLNDADAGVRYFAVKAALNIVREKPSPELVKRLLELEKDPSPLISKEIIKRLSELRPQSK